MSPRTQPLVLPARHPGWVDVDDAPRQRLRQAFVGRGRELRRILQAMNDPRLVAAALTGERGIGKTRLLDEAVGLADPGRYASIRIDATRSSTHTSLAGFSAYLPPSLITPPINAYAFATAADTLRCTAPGRDLLFAVDDVSLLDGASVTLLSEMARHGGVFIVVVLDAGAPAPEPIAALSHAGLIDWLELSPLSRDDVAELVCSALDGQIDGLLIQRLWEETAGNALLLRELVTAQLDAGALSDDAGLWRLTGDLAVPVGLVRLIHERTSTLSSASLHVLELLAFGGRIRMDDLCAATTPAAVEAAESHGSIRVDYAATGDAYVQLAYPLYGTVLRATMPRVRAGQRRTELAALATVHRGTTPARDLTRFVAAADDAAHLATAAWEAWRARDIHRARELSLHVAEAGMALDVIEPLGYSLMLSGSAERAEDVLGGLPTSCADDRSRITRVRAINAHFGLGRPRRAHELVRGALSPGAGAASQLDDTALRALLELLDGDARGAAATAGLAAVPPAGPATVARADVIRELSAVFSDRLDGSGRQLTDAFTSARAQRTGDAGEIPWLEIIGELAIVHGLIWNGDLAAAGQRADDGYTGAVEAGRVLDIVVFCLLRAITAGLRGTVADQISHCREGLALAREQDLRPFIPILLAALAHGEALTGDRVAARDTLAEAQSRRGQSLAVLTPWIDLYAIWADPDTRHTSQGTRAELAREQAVAAGSVGFEAIALHGLVRLGLTERCRARLRDLASGGRHTAAGIYADHADAIAAQDTGALGRVSARFERSGALMHAAEATALQSQLYLAAGRRDFATAAVTRAMTLTAACTGLADLPGITIVDMPRITHRECEIASLAADGLSSREISLRLVLSVRTVENHLQRVYRKLGIRNRAELAERRPMLAAVPVDHQPGVNGSH